MPERAPLSPLLWALVIGLGVALRIYAFAQNTRLQGDVNLLALTAREYAESGDLYYPLKYTSPPYVPYAALREPATQHPLLVPWLAGIACRLWGTDDAFAILKLLSAAGCILHWLLAAALAWRYCGAYAWLPIFLTAFSPLVVDYSANGSPYITAAALMLFPFLWLLRRRSPGAAVCAALGLLCGVGFQIHGFFLAILAGCLWAVSRAKPARAILRAFLLLAVFLFSLVPTVIWSWRHTGMWLCASTLQHPAGRLGWIKEIKGAGGTWNIVEPSLSTAKILAFLGEAGYQSLVALRHALEEFGPFALFLAGVALTHLWRVRRYRRAFLGIAVPYLALIAAWSAFQLRFLVPAAALLFVAAGVGWRRLWRSQRQICRILAYLCAAGGLLWPAALWMQNIPMRYYPPQVAREYGARYEKMRALALRLARLERGLVAGWTQASGGGLESVYWHRMPFIDLRGADAEKVKRILGDFPVRYLWCECREIEKIKGWPFAFRLLMQNGGYAVFEVSRGPGKEDAPLEKNR